jgi:hypothetical protein
MDSVTALDDAPMTIVSVDLTETVQALGPLRLIRAEWWTETPHFVLLQYALHGEQQDDYLRLDLDKRSIIDEINDRDLKETLQHTSGDIWAIVVGEQERLATEA